MWGSHTFRRRFIYRGLTYHGSRFQRSRSFRLKKMGGGASANDESKSFIAAAVRLKNAPNIGPRSHSRQDGNSRNCGFSSFPTNTFATELADKGYPFQKGCSPARLRPAVANVTTPSIRLGMLEVRKPVAPGRRARKASSSASPYNFPRKVRLWEVPGRPHSGKSRVVREDTSARRLPRNRSARLAAGWAVRFVITNCSPLVGAIDHVKIAEPLLGNGGPSPIRAHARLDVFRRPG